MDKFTTNVAITLEHPLAVWHLIGNQAKIVDIFFFIYQYNF